MRRKREITVFAVLARLRMSTRAGLGQHRAALTLVRARQHPRAGCHLSRGVDTAPGRVDTGRGGVDTVCGLTQVEGVLTPRGVLTPVEGVLTRSAGAPGCHG